jgi:hypothetical protein
MTDAALWFLGYHASSPQPGPGRFLPFGPRAGSHTFSALDGGQPVRWYGLSAFQALDLFATNRIPELESWLTDWQGISGYRLNMLRVFASKPAAQNNAGQQFPGWNRPDVAVLPEFFSFLAGMGLGAEITLITDVQSDLTWVRGWVDVLGPIAGAHVEGVNEPDDRKNRPSALEPYGVLTLPRYASGDYDPATPWKGTQFTLHPERKADVYDAASQAKTAVEVFVGGWTTPVGPFNGCHCVCIMDEPGKFEDFANNDAAIRQFYQGSSLMSGGATVHTLNSQFCWAPTTLDRQFGAVAFKGLATFDPNVPNLPYAHDTDDERRTGAINTYKMGDYGCRFGGALTAPEVFGPGIGAQ